MVDCDGARVLADRCSRCIAAAEPASAVACSQLMPRAWQRVQGLDSSHLTRAFAQAWQAWATLAAAGDELSRRFLVLPSSLSSWFARCRFRRSARPNALPHWGLSYKQTKQPSGHQLRTTSHAKRLPKVWVAMCLWRCSGRLYLLRQSAHWYRLVVVAWLRGGEADLGGDAPPGAGYDVPWATGRGGNDGGACDGRGRASPEPAEGDWKAGSRGRSRAGAGPSSCDTASGLVMATDT